MASIGRQCNETSCNATLVTAIHRAALYPCPQRRLSGPLPCMISLNWHRFCHVHSSSSLTYSLRKTMLDCLWEPEPILQVLNVVPRNKMPKLTKQLLWDFAWIGMDLASRFGDLDLLKFMLNWSKLPNGGPAQCTAKAIAHASGAYMAGSPCWRGGSLARIHDTSCTRIRLCIPPQKW
ncbi:hypothetical protein BCR44DRAFT_307315 [Catenaria anguillulae PL171]|uniref:Uncharacterized protein n=1 Tax=Catenaria anguillulae PL171 TaxID=765915 RepID=A0A1Y2HWT0_9FUNG|nr:hypothetical protein BCR44DRAFT_307315 [Catenaria anguillulae PL171]